MITLLLIQFDLNTVSQQKLLHDFQLKEKGLSPLPQPHSLGWEESLEEGTAIHSAFLPGESHRQRSLAGYSPWGCRESDMTERLSTEHIPFGRVFNQLRDCLIKPTSSTLQLSCLFLGGRDLGVPYWMPSQYGVSSILAGHPAPSARDGGMSLGLRWVVSEGKPAELSSQVYRMLRFQRGKWDVHLNCIYCSSIVEGK